MQQKNALPQDQQSAMTIEEHFADHRPLLRFTPPTGWMNDPNGLLYAYGVYHLFYQHNPHALHHGPMYWGHAKSRDLLHWEHLPIALSPDELGDIFSGSAILDENNVSALGEDGTAPILLFFTHHRREERIGQVQEQSIAYSTDKGESFHKYKGNPVIQQPGECNFRDPKVFWHEESHSFVMVIAAGRKLRLYRSVNLLDWEALSVFVPEGLSHDGILECPDLIRFGDSWVLILSLTVTERHDWTMVYKTGHFDGTNFIPDGFVYQTLDYGRDHYAAVSFAGLPEGRQILLGWMNCWTYAEKIPAVSHRGSMTLARELRLLPGDEEPRLSQSPIVSWEREVELEVNKVVHLPQVPFMLSAKLPREDFSLAFSNAKDSLTIRYDHEAKELCCDRSACGMQDFSPDFTPLSKAPVDSGEDGLELQIVVDVSTVEVFADKGRTVVSSRFFTEAAFTELAVRTGAVPTELCLRW